MNRWFPTYDGCNDEDGNEYPVPIPGCWGGSNKFLKQLILHQRVGIWKTLFSLPVGRDTHIYFSSNLPRPPCALCDSNLIIFLWTAIFRGRAGAAGMKIFWCFLVQVNAMVKLTPHAPNPEATDKHFFGFLLQLQVDSNSQPVTKYERSSKLLYFVRI